MKKLNKVCIFVLVHPAVILPELGEVGVNMTREPKSFLDLFDRVLVEPKSPETKEKLQMLKQHQAFSEWLISYQAMVKKSLSAS